MMSFGRLLASEVVSLLKKRELIGGADGELRSSSPALVRPGVIHAATASVTSNSCQPEFPLKGVRDSTRESKRDPAEAHALAPSYVFQVAPLPKLPLPSTHTARGTR